MIHNTVRPSTQTTQPLEALIEEARRVFEADERVIACWLEGSFAAGSPDPWSDVDLHVAVRDEAWDGFFATRMETLAAIRPVLGYAEFGLPWGAHIVAASLAGPARLDLCLEMVSRLAAALRPEEPRLLFDRSEVAGSLKATPNLDAVIRMRLEEIMRTFFFGSAFPVRLWGREEWGSLFANAVIIVYQFLVPAMLVQDSARHFFRPPLHNERHLSPERRRAVDDLLAQVHAAFAGIGTRERDYKALLRAHERLIGAIWREFRAACKKHGVVYPEAAEREMREYYRRELGMEVA